MYIPVKRVLMYIPVIVSFCVILPLGDLVVIYHVKHVILIRIFMFKCQSAN